MLASSYTTELLFKIFSFLISFFFSSIILFFKIHTLIFIETSVFSVLFVQKFLTIMVFDYINLFWFLIWYYTSLTNVFFFWFLLIRYSSSQFFNYQRIFLYIIAIWLNTFLLTLFIFFYFYFLPNFLTFLINWQFLEQLQEVVVIELTPLLTPYVVHLLKLKSIFIFFLLSFIFFLLSFIFVQFQVKWIIIKLRAGLYCLVSFSVLVLFTTGLLTQIVFFALSFLLLEGLYLLTIIKTIIKTHYDYKTNYTE